MTKPIEPIVLKLLFYTLLQVLFLGCTQTHSVNQSKATTASDSLQLWISKGKDQTISDTLKTQLFKKAYKNLAVVQSDSLKCNYFITLSFELADSKNKKLFREINTEGIAFAEQLKDSICLSSLYWDLGYFLRNNAVPDSAYASYAKAEKIYTGLKDDYSSGRVLLQMANIQNSIGDYTGSEITTIRAIEKLKPLNRYRELYLCYSNLGDVTKLLSEYDRALDYYEEALVYLKKDKTPLISQQSHKNNVGLVYQKQGLHKKAGAYFSEVVKFEDIYKKKPFLYARALNNLAYSKLKLNETGEVPELLNQAFNIQDSIDDIGGKSSTTYKLSEYFLKLKDTTGALTALNRAKEFAELSGDNKRMLEVLRMYPKVDPKNATEYTLAYVHLNDSLQDQERQLRDKFARIRFETDEFIAENQLLARQRQLWSGIAFSILLLSVAAFVIISQRIKNQKLRFQQEQQASNQEIFSLLLAQGEKLEEGKQIEQKRISEELHDGVQGRLQGARMMLLGLNKRDDDDAKSERARAIVMLKDVQEEVRAISHELSHAAYQKIHNFILSLEDLKTTIANSANIEIDFKYATQLDWDALSGDIKINMYRIIQETLQNAIKHAQCTKIDLNLEADAKHVKVSIIDNGKGFLVKKGKKGIGMRNIASRMKKVDGTWDIISEIGKGTTVTLVIPIDESDKTKSVTNELKNLQKA